MLSRSEELGQSWDTTIFDEGTGEAEFTEHEGATRIDTFVNRRV